MSLEMMKIARLAGLCSVGALLLAGWLWRLRKRLGRNEAQLRRHRLLREEMEVYVRLDLTVSEESDARRMSERVCRAVADASPFRRVAMILCDPHGELRLEASVGMETGTVGSLEAWCARLCSSADREGRAIRRGEGGLGEGVSDASSAVILAQRPECLGYLRVVVTPMWTIGGRLLGALVVGADSMKSARPGALAEALFPLEGLAARMARSIENVALAEKMLRSERLAGLGRMAGGVAHAVSSPLTAVIGFAELIANTTAEARVRSDAATILREAHRIRQTVDSLVEFGRRPSDEQVGAVELMTVVRALVVECSAKLESRGIGLIVHVTGQEPVVRGSRPKLREMLEHLLNHASQAVGEAQPAGDSHLIRISVSRVRDSGHLVVSHTGRRFSEPRAVFDPFGAEAQEQALGLLHCHAIVRDLAGEIRAFNLHPRGAAIAVELPIHEGERTQVPDTELEERPQPSATMEPLSSEKRS